MAISYQESIKQKTKEVIIVTFSGRQQGLATLTLFEFTNFLDTTFPFYDKIYCKDEKVKWYNQGLTDLTSNVDETVDFLRHKITGYKHAIFIGASMGGYAALLFGSILNVDAIVAFRPQTYISKCIKDFDPKYEDVTSFINSKTKYYIYGDASIEDPDDIHSIEYCYHIINNSENLSTMELKAIPNFDIKEYKNSGVLTKDFNNIMIDVLFPYVIYDEIFEIDNRDEEK